MTIEVALPVLHPGQIAIFRARARLNAVRCGRRWGKTKQMVTLAADRAAKGKKVGLFTPEHKQLHEPYDELLGILHPVKLRANKNEGTIRTTTGGFVDFWTLNDNELAGRGREYDLVMIDEAAFTKSPQMKGIWEKSIKPTMLTRPKSAAWVFSTPSGIDSENFFWRCCNDPEMGFKPHYAPTSSNPYVPADELERERRDNHPLVFKQEYLAEFVDWSGVAFFPIEKLLVDGMPLGRIEKCDAVFALVDTAIKDGKEHDGTAAVYFARNVTQVDGAFCSIPLAVIDWDAIQVPGNLLEAWLPNVFANCEALAREMGARQGSIGTWIEDKNVGSVLLQQAVERKWPAHPIESRLTALGKDARAIAVSGNVHRGEVKISRHAHDKTINYKGATRNHFEVQVTSFRIGDKTPNRQDDLLDDFCYGIALSICQDWRE